MRRFLVGLQAKLFFGVFLTTIQKSFLKITVIAMAGFASVRILPFIYFQLGNADESNTQNTLLATNLLIMCSMLPILMFMFLSNNYHQLKKPNFQQRYGSLYSNVNANKKQSLVFNCSFMARRYFYALSIGFFDDIPSIQVVVQITLSFMLLIYLISVQPFQQKSDNYIEIFNEVTILIIFYSLIPLANDGNISPEFKYKIAFFIIAVILTNIAVNFLIFVVNIGMIIFLKIKEVFTRIITKIRMRNQYLRQMALFNQRVINKENPLFGQSHTHDQPQIQNTSINELILEDITDNMEAQPEQEQSYKFQREENKMSEMDRGPIENKFFTINNTNTAQTFEHQAYNIDPERNQKMEHIKAMINYFENDENLQRQKEQLAQRIQKTQQLLLFNQLKQYPINTANDDDYDDIIFKK